MVCNYLGIHGWIHGILNIGKSKAYFFTTLEHGRVEVSFVTAVSVQRWGGPYANFDREAVDLLGLATMGSCEEFEIASFFRPIQSYLNYPSILLARSFCWSISPKGRQEIRQVCAMRWGLVPSFAKNEEEYNAFKGGNSTFNARIEGAIGSEVCALCRCSLIWPCHARYEKQSSLLRLERLERCWNPKSLETASGQAPLHRTLWWLLWMEGLEGLNETVLLKFVK